MSELEEEAAAFKRKKEQSAARVARHRERQRTGTKTYPVQLDRIVAGQLIRAREIPLGANDADIGAEIANVVAAALSGRLRVTPRFRLRRALIYRQTRIGRRRRVSSGGSVTRVGY